MEAICSSETSVDTQRTTRHYIPDDGTLYFLVLLWLLLILQELQKITNCVCLCNRLLFTAITYYTNSSQFCTNGHLIVNIIIIIIITI
jgi:hypothetical protein